jgi:hypothetical protein
MIGAVAVSAVPVQRAWFRAGAPRIDPVEALRGE